MALAALVEEVFDQAPGRQVIDVAPLFAGAGLRYSASGGAIVPSTGRLSLPTDAPAEARAIVVTAENRFGQASLTVRFTVEESEEAPQASLSFASPRIVQLVIYEGRIVEHGRQPAAGAALVPNGLDPWSQVGAAGTLDGVGGNFSGARHLTAPQLFAPWPAAAGTDWSPLFAPSDPATNRAAVDEPGTWTLRVNGAPRAVETVHRRTVPVRTRAVDLDGTRRSARRHLVSLTLSTDLSPGDSVEVEAAAIATVLSATFRDSLPSEAIHVCQEGFATAGPKKAYVGLWLGHDRTGAGGTTDGAVSASTSWRLVRALDGGAVATGRLALAKAGGDPHEDGANHNGCDIYEADFSAWSKPGEYRLEVEGVGSSTHFPIAGDPHAEALRLAARAYFFQRSGCAILMANGEGIERPRNGHPADGLAVWRSGLRLGRTHEGFGSSDPFAAFREVATGATGVPNPDAWGGWHDAGDWDRRIQHMEAIYWMAELVESVPAARALDLNLPESGKPFAHPDVQAKRGAADQGDGATVLPDLIHEALWGISLWRRTQRGDGAVIGGVEYSRDGIEGSVSWNPVQIAYAYDVEEWAAYKFAMAACKLGHVITTVCGDATLGQALIDEGVAAWTWAESVLATGLDAENGSGGDPFTAAEAIRLDRVRAAPVVYRAAGSKSAHRVWQSYNSYAAQAGTGLPQAGTWVGWHPYDYAVQGLDYRRAGLEGRSVAVAISDAVQAWASDLDQVVGTPVGTDYGLQANGMYPWGPGWFRFGPGSNWMAARFAVHAAATGAITPRVRDGILQGTWFALGCNPSNVSLVLGLGARQFGQHLLIDFAYPGALAAGPAAGELRDWERDFLADSLFPKSDADWPRHARIFESHGAVLSSEFDVKSNLMEWLIGCAMAVQATAA